MPLHKRGHDALEKEIELIKLRQDKCVFIDGLLELKQKARSFKWLNVKARWTVIS